MKKLIAPLLLFAAMLIPVATFPTCIIILRDSNGDVYVVADRLATGAGGHALQPYCKIYQNGNYYYAIAGWAPLMTKKYFEAALRQPIGFRQQLKYFISTLEREDSILIAQGRLDKNAEQSSLRGNDLVDIGLAYFADGRTVTKAVTFHLQEKGKAKFIIDSLRENEQVLPLGLREHIYDGNDDVKRLASEDKGDPIKFCTDLIQMERGYNHTDAISKEVDVFMLTKDGVPRDLSGRKCPF